MRILLGVMCPKCQNAMTTVDKDGIHIEQCGGCRGVFLDRGELEQIVEAENAYYGHRTPPPYDPGAARPAPGGPAGPAPAPPPHAAPPPPPPTRPYGYGDSPAPYRGKPAKHGGHHDSPSPYRGGYRDSPRPYGNRRRRSFLESLFD